MRRLKGDECLPALALCAEHGDEDARVTQIRSGFDAGQRHEADSGILELADPLRQHLADRFVDASHTLAHVGYSSGCRPGDRYSTVTTSRVAPTSSNS